MKSNISKVILISFFLTLALFLSSCETDGNLLKDDNTSADNKTGTEIYKVVKVYISEDYNVPNPKDYNDFNDIKEIHIANVAVNESGGLILTVIKEVPDIERLKSAIKEIESKEGLFLEYEDRVGDTFYYKRELVYPSSPLYVYALGDEIAIQYWFNTELS